MLVAEMGWREAVIKVLQGKNEAMHYTDIADENYQPRPPVLCGGNACEYVNVTISEFSEIPWLGIAV